MLPQHGIQEQSTTCRVFADVGAPSRCCILSTRAITPRRLYRGCATRAPQTLVQLRTCTEWICATRALQELVQLRVCTRWIREFLAI